MAVVTCPKCESRYDPGMDEELEGIDPRQMSLKVVCPVCAQWLRLPETSRSKGRPCPAEILEAMMGQSRLIQRGAGAGSVGSPKKPWWRFW
jgi:hypothetical protein